ncbi:hypothetical protein EZS27_032687 [termite gut metagenome]|uniref:Uncharacterized protein n=1 Tax=termite gut metagenome TaxID=433724 RepID=A0A5J4Q7H3_9ZZZZ
MTEVTDGALQSIAEKETDEFINLLTGKYLETLNGELKADTMALLNVEQHSLLAYRIFRNEIMNGGVPISSKRIWRIHIQ